MLGGADALRQAAQAVDADGCAHREIGAGHEIDGQAARAGELGDLRRAAHQRQHGDVLRHVERHARGLETRDVAFGVLRLIGRDERRERAAQAFDAGAIERRWWRSGPRRRERW